MKKTIELNKSEVEKIKEIWLKDHKKIVEDWKERYQKAKEEGRKENQEIRETIAEFFGKFALKFPLRQALAAWKIVFEEEIIQERQEGRKEMAEILFDKFEKLVKECYEKGLVTEMIIIEGLPNLKKEMGIK